MNQKQLKIPERRRSTRIKLLETFNIFISIPKKGFFKLEAQDISETGIKFDLDIENEPSSIFPAQIRDIIEFRIYINSNLFIPTKAKLVRIEERLEGRRIGAEFQDQHSLEHQAILTFIHFLNDIQKVARIDSQPI